MMVTREMHRHRAVRTEVYAFVGPVPGARENPAAHGNVCEYSYCRCGARRRTNVNQWYSERGPWVERAEWEGAR